MNLQKAKRILQTLADNIDPASGHVLSADNKYENREIYSAIKIVLAKLPTRENTAMLMKAKQDKNLKEGKPKNFSLPWTGESKFELAMKYKSGATIQELRDYFQRSEKAIKKELENLGLAKFDY